VVSDHDPRLTRALAGQAWARTFTAGDPDSLAAVLREAIDTPPPRPDSDVAAALGLLTPEQALAAFTDLHRGLPERSRR